MLNTGGGVRGARSVVVGGALAAGYSVSSGGGHCGVVVLSGWGL